MAKATQTITQDQNQFRSKQLHPLHCGLDELLSFFTTEMGTGPGSSNTIGPFLTTGSLVARILLSKVCSNEVTGGCSNAACVGPSRMRIVPEVLEEEEEVMMLLLFSICGREEANSTGRASEEEGGEVSNEGE